MQSILVTILTAIILAALVVAVGLNLVPFIDVNSSIGQFLRAEDWSPSFPFQHVPAVVISAGVLLALFTFSREREKLSGERARLYSEQLLKQATTGLDEVLELLRNRNNNRIIWVRAARSLLQARALGAKIEVDELQQAYRLYEHRIRNELYLILTQEDSKTGDRLPLPPQFFYGINDWDKFRTLDEIAVEVSSPIEAYLVTIDEIPPEPHLPPLSEKSVVAIFDFLEYPSEYEDLLQEVDIWEEDWRDVHGAKAGATRYIAHQAQKYAVDGKLYDRPQDTEAANNALEQTDEDASR